MKTFFGDEAGFEGNPRPRQRWLKRGSRPAQSHVRQIVVGAVNPVDGRLVSLIVAHNDMEVFQVFLDTMAREVPAEEGKRVVLVLDNAGWHKSKALHWHHIEGKFPPAHSPDFNPIQRLWQHLKSHHLANFLTKRAGELSDKIFDSIRDLPEKPEVIRSVCTTHSPFPRNELKALPIQGLGRAMFRLWGGNETQTHTSLFAYCPPRGYRMLPGCRLARIWEFRRSRLRRRSAVLRGCPIGVSCDRTLRLCIRGTYGSLRRLRGRNG